MFLGLQCQLLSPAHEERGSLDIDEREEVLEHEGVVRLGVVPRDTDVFVHIERDDVLCVSAVPPVHDLDCGHTLNDTLPSSCSLTIRL